MSFLDNLKTITQKGNMETRQITPFFSSTFSDLTVCNIHFWIWKYTKNPYYVLSPEWSQKKVSAHGLKSSRNNYDGNKKQSHTSGKPKIDNVKNKSNADS